MKNGLKFTRLVVTALLSLLLWACGGEDTVYVNDGTDATIVVPVVDYADRARVNINSVVENEDHTVTIHFSAFSVVPDGNDIAMIGLSEPRFTLAKLVPEQDGKPSKWVSFINSTETGDDPTGASVTVLQATYDRDSDNAEKRFTDNGNGTYSFKLKEKVLAAVNPITGTPITWDAGATHRVGMQISANSNNTVNATYDWVPSGASITDQRNIVDTETCNSCHGELKLHGSRVDTQYCVTCHNPGSSDSQSGNTVDFTPLIHKIHRGKNLPSMDTKGDGAVYEIVGYRDSVHNYAKNIAGEISGVALPQDIRGCSNCHSADNEATPQGDNWKLNASVVACTSCHDDIAFSQEEIDTDLNLAGEPWKLPHPNGFVEGDTCSSCHGANSGNTSPAYAHETVLKQAKAAIDLLDISFVRVERITGGFLEIDVQINYAGVGIPNFASFAATNIGSGHGYLLVNADQGAGYTKSYGTVQHYLSDPEVCAPSDSGLYTCIIRKNVATDTDPIWEPVITETGTLSLMTSDMNLCVNAKSSNPQIIDCTSNATSYIQVETVPAKHVEGFYDLGDGATPGVLTAKTDYDEKIGADMASCQNCHADDGLHMESHPHAATDLAQCANCHNATRLSYYDGRPADLKSHVHTLHANNDSSHPLEAYPNNIATCTACHTDEQYDLPLAMNTRSSKSGIDDLGDGLFTSPMVTVCASCHVKDMPVGLIAYDGVMDADRQAGLSSDDLKINTTVIAHMLKYGGEFGQPANVAAYPTPELCADCHAKDEVKGVEAAHGL